MSSEAVDPVAAGSWPRRALSDLVDERGITYGVVQPGHHRADGTPILRVNNITPDGLKLDQPMRIDPDIAARHDRSRLTGGEVLITLVGSVGQVAVASPDLVGWNVARAVGVIPVRQEIPARWVAWCLRTPEARQYLDARLNTTVQTTLNLRDLAAVQIPVPPDPVLRGIASVLAALDDKIDSNRRVARLLEETAATLFHSRFVHFVGVEDFEDSEIGRIPRGWTVGVLADLVSVTMGQSPPGSSYSEDPTDGLLLVQGMGGFGDRYPTSEIYTSAPTKRARAGATLMTVRAPVGAVNVARTEVCLGRGVAGFDSEHLAFTESLVRSLNARWASEESGTIFPAVNRGQVLGLRVVVPPAETVREFDRLATPIVKMLVGLHDEGALLVRLRDSLLPKLISGQIRVPDASDTASVIEPIADAITATS
jgi:type I restriction enzyme S subunit